MKVRFWAATRIDWMRRRIGPGSRRSATSETKHLSMKSIRPCGDMIG